MYDSGRIDALRVMGLKTAQDEGEVSPRQLYWRRFGGMLGGGVLGGTLGSVAGYPGALLGSAVGGGAGNYYAAPESHRRTSDALGAGLAFHLPASTLWYPHLQSDKPVQ